MIKLSFRLILYIILLLNLIFWVPLLVYIGLLLYSATRIQCNRCDDCTDCCFLSNSECRCRFLGIRLLHKVFYNRIDFNCPCCYHSSFADWKDVNRQLGKYYFGRQAVIILSLAITLWSIIPSLIKLISKI